MPQSAILTDPPVAFPGQIAYPMFPRRVHSRNIVQVAGIPFGRFVARQAENKVKLPTSAGEVTTTGEGFTVRDPTKEFDAAGWANGDMAPIIRSGYIWVDTEGAVTEEGAVFVRHTANGGLTELGKARADADTANASAVPNARFMTSTTGAGLAIVELR
jgi:hypothetical protein